METASNKLKRRSVLANSRYVRKLSLSPAVAGNVASGIALEQQAYVPHFFVNMLDGKACKG
jgi:hypothetical protein